MLLNMKENTTRRNEIVNQFQTGLTAQASCQRVAGRLPVIVRGPCDLFVNVGLIECIW